MLNLFQHPNNTYKKNGTKRVGARLAIILFVIARLREAISMLISSFLSLPSKEKKQKKVHRCLSIYLKRNFDSLNKTNSSLGLKQRFVFNASLIPFLSLRARPITDRRRMRKCTAFRPICKRRPAKMR
jgi:hypothetical protein